MRFVAIAAGFDGTLARSGRCDQRCVEALRMLASTGRKLLLVTARELRELLGIFPEARIFDYVIAENGAVMHRPSDRVSSILAEAPSETLLRELRLRCVSPLSVGSSIITTCKENAAVVNEVIERLRLDYRVLANDNALIILPAGVDKASGVSNALRELGLSAHNLVAIGDAPNDLALFALAEYSIAVHNAHPALKAAGNTTTQADYCEGFLEAAQRIMRDDLNDALPRHRIALGHDANGDECGLQPFQDSLLLVGPRGSGKRRLCKAMLNRLGALDYQCCVIAAESGNDVGLSRGLSVYGSQHEVPRLTDVMHALEQSGAGVFVNVAGFVVAARGAFIEALLLQLQALHDRAGRPHAIAIVDVDAHLPNAGLSLNGWLSEITVICTTSNAEMNCDDPGFKDPGFKKVIQLGMRRVESDTARTRSVPLMIEDLPTLPAILLSRAGHAAPQATIGGRAGVAPSASLAATESEASGY